MRAALASILFFAVSNAAAMTAERVQFPGFVLPDVAPPVAFDLHVPARERVGLILPGGTTLSIAAPGGAEEQLQAQARLVSASGEIVHTATISDTAVASTSFAYRVCGNEAVFMSPAPATAQPCPAAP